VHDELPCLGETVRGIRSERLEHVIRLKRIFDIILAVAALIVFSPVILLAAIIIKIESPGPVLYSQERIGLNRRRIDRRTRVKRVQSDKRNGSDRRRTRNVGRPFNILKLRTMRIGSEMYGPVLASDNDPRITRFGRFMRKARIDEIPQFLNVIRGDMSIIGPRPERPFFIKKHKNELPEFDLRLFVKPGITGLAQVESGYTKTVDHMRKRLLYDLRYISKLSFMQEFKIILKTFYVVLTGKGAC
jgi:lipopolysaccharide/colanic/teichoic acid biosynthesis glycosyltransferase